MNTWQSFAHDMLIIAISRYIRAVFDILTYRKVTVKRQLRDDLLRILSVLNRRFVWKSSETQDSIYEHVRPCIDHSHVNRLHKNLFVISRRFLISAFGYYCCHAILIGPERRLLIAGPNRLGIKLFL